MKKSTWSLLFSLTLVLHLSAQKPESASNEMAMNTVLKGKLTGLKKASGEEISKIASKSNAPLTIGDSFPVYDEQGKELTQDEMMKHFINGGATDFYIDENYSVSAAVIKITKDKNEEKSDDSHQSELIGHTAPDFLVRDINGKNHSIEKLQGKVIVLNFWSVECKECVMEMPELNRLMYKYKDQEVVFLSLAMNKTNRLKIFLGDFDFHYSIIPDSKEQADAYKVKLFPANIVIGRDLKIRMLKEGYSQGTANALSNVIDEALKAPKIQ